LLTELDERFNALKRSYKDTWRLIPDLVISAHYQNIDWVSPILKFGEQFASDLPLHA